MVLATNLGFPRIGVNRELKKAVEGYWKGNASKEDLLAAARDIRKKHWTMQKDAGLDHIPSNDFSFYDQVLDMSCTLGCVPPRYNWDGGAVGLDTYFAMARGSDAAPAMEMTKWFDTNYHYIVPEFYEGQNFKLSSQKIFDEFAEARAMGITTRPVLIGPMTYVRLGKARYEDFKPAEIIQKLLPVYGDILKKLAEMGAQWVQIDEPYLALDLCEGARAGFPPVYEALAAAAPELKILVATYFDGLRDNMDLAFGLPVAAIHVDLCRAPEQFDETLAKLPQDKMISLGLIDGRNIWRADLRGALEKLQVMTAEFGTDRIMVGPSCSLLHSPIDLDAEDKLDPEIKNWMAFAKQKLDEIKALAKGMDESEEAIADMLRASDEAVDSRKSSPRIHNDAVQSRIKAIKPEMARRKSSFHTRRELQRKALGLPSYPTTTIGSFPQTGEIRKARAAYKKNEIDYAAYEKEMQAEVKRVVDFQEEAGLDMLVHGEPERNDMVEYFGERLDGFTFTKNGWVQSYGSRCVKPPVIFGDVSRPQAMTVKWAQFAQSLTDRPMKGMLTGPITILCWSFARDDQPRELTCRQIALALRDEVVDLEAAGIKAIQIDEPAIREGLPLRREDWGAYLAWAVESFKLASCGVRDETQIHTHMCYSEFNDIIESIGALDADVISVEASRSQMDLLDSFVAYKYPNEIGPGVYDIHSPRVPSAADMQALLEKAEKVLKSDQLWVNPDCGLKTRGWAEVEPALKNMVAAAKAMREKVKASAAA